MQPLLTIFVILALVFVQLHTSANALTTELIYPIPGDGFPHHAVVTILPDVSEDDHTPGVWKASARYEMLPSYVEAGLHFVRGSWNVTCQYFGGPEITRPLGDLRMSVRDVSQGGIELAFQYLKSPEDRPYKVKVRARAPSGDQQPVDICELNMRTPTVDTPTRLAYLKFVARTSLGINTPTTFNFAYPSIRLDHQRTMPIQPVTFKRLTEGSWQVNLRSQQAQAQSRPYGYIMEHHSAYNTSDGAVFTRAPTQFRWHPTLRPAVNHPALPPGPLNPNRPRPSTSRPSVIQPIPQGRPGKRQRSPSPSSSN